jgi:hypothetical protein
MPVKITESATKELRKAQRIVREDIQPFLEAFGEEVQAKLVGRIQRQSFHHAPLSEQYLAAKKAAGLNWRILIATGDYLKSIKVTVRKNSVTIAPDKKFEALAGMLEFGTRTMPPRPHWEPIKKWSERKWKEFIRDFEAVLFEDKKPDLSGGPE